MAKRDRIAARPISRKFTDDGSLRERAYRCFVRLAYAKIKALDDYSCAAPFQIVIHARRRICAGD